METTVNTLGQARAKLSKDPSTNISQLNPRKWGWWTCKELASELGVPVDTIRDRALNGRIIARKPAWLGYWLIPAVEVKRLLEQASQTND